MKVLEQNGVDIENVDGAAFNNFCAGGQNGILSGVMNQCVFSTPSSNTLSIATGEIIVQGFRIKLTEATVFTFSGYPVTDTQYYIIITVAVSASHNVSVEINYSSDPTVTQDNIFSADQGTYQVELGRFVHKQDGTLDQVERTLPVISGNSQASSIRIGNTTVTEQQIISLLNLIS